MNGQLRVQRGGDGEPVLLLLHGLGVNGDVWKLVPDPVILPGLGHSAHVESPGALRPLLRRLASFSEA